MATLRVRANHVSGSTVDVLVVHGGEDLANDVYEAFAASPKFDDVRLETQLYQLIRRAED